MNIDNDDRFNDEPLESIYQRETPWAGVATDLKEAPRTVKEAMVAAGLDWTVRLAPLFAKYDLSSVQLQGEMGSPEPETAAFENLGTNANAVVRESDRSVLGIVGPSYVPVQNSDAFKFFDPAIEAGLIRVETAGATRGGKKVWMLARIVGASLDVVPGDEVRGYFLVANGHDGSMAVRAGFTNIRVCCSNTLRMAVSGDEIVRILHTKNATVELDRLQEVVGFHKERFERSVDQMRQLARKDVTEEVFREYVRVVFEIAETDVEALDRRMESLLPLFESGKGVEIDGVHGTVWGALNAVTEYLNWQRGNDQNARVSSLWFGEGGSIGQRAFREALKIAT